MDRRRRWYGMGMMDAGITYGSPQTLTLRPDGATGYDTFLQNTDPSNHAASASLYVGEYSGLAFINRSLIKFDLTSIPSNAVIISATLKLYLIVKAGSANAATIRVYRQKRNWVDSQASWANFATGNAWQTAGGFGVNDCEQDDIGSLAFSADPTLNQYYLWSLTPAKVQEWIDGTLTNLGMMLKNDTELNDDLAFASSNVVTATQRPVMEVVYKVPL